LIFKVVKKAVSVRETDFAIAKETVLNLIIGAGAGKRRGSKRDNFYSLGKRFSDTVQATVDRRNTKAFRALYLTIGKVLKMRVAAA